MQDMRKHKGLRDAEKYAVLASAYDSPEAQEGTAVKNADVGGYRTKTVRAGDFLYVSCYPLIGCNADRKQRERLRELKVRTASSAKLRAKYAKYNNRRRVTEFEQLVHANMVNGDLHVVCTYAFQDYTDYNAIQTLRRAEVKKYVYNYIRKIKRFLKCYGCDLNEFRWICVTVTREGMEDSVRPFPERHHHHIFMHGVPSELRKDIENMWNYGYCNADRLHDSGAGFGAISAYVARQESSANGENGGERSYTTSRNIKRPRVTTSDSKISRRRAAKIAADVAVNAREIFERKLFQGFRLVEDAQVKISGYTAGVYIYAKLRRNTGIFMRD